MHWALCKLISQAFKLKTLSKESSDRTGHFLTKSKFAHLMS